MPELIVTVSQEVIDSFLAIYPGFSPDGKVTPEQYVADSLATYLENAHVGYQARMQEAELKQPYEKGQADRAEAAKPIVAEKADAEPADATALTGTIEAKK